MTIFQLEVREKSPYETKTSISGMRVIMSEASMSHQILFTPPTRRAIKASTRIVNDHRGCREVLSELSVIIAVEMSAVQINTIRRIHGAFAARLDAD